MTTPPLPPSRRGRRLGAALVAGAVSLLGISIVVAPPASAATILVTNAGDSGTGSLREAIAKAADGDHPGEDTISFGDIGGPIHLLTPLEIDSDLTITGQGISVDGDDATQLFVVTGDATATIGQVHMYDGFTTGNGGAISVEQGGRLTLDRAEIHDNAAANGGAIYVAGGGSLTLTNTTPEDGYMSMWVYDNDATTSGGGIYLDQGDPGATLSTTDARLFGNDAAQGGGAIYAADVTTVTMVGSNVTSNHGGSQGGGGILSVGGDVTITRGQLAHNTGLNGAAIRQQSGAQLTMISSRVWENTGASQGGALRTDGGATRIANSMVTRNGASAGAAISATGNARLEILDSTIVDNDAGPGEAQVDAYDIFLFDLQSSIVAMVTPDDSTDLHVYAHAGSTANGYVDHSLVRVPAENRDANLIEDGEGNIEAGTDPQLAFHGDDVWSAASSPVVDAAGDPVADDGDVDVRGLPRVVGEAMDMGAVELQSAGEPVLTLASDQGASDSDGITNADYLEFAVSGAPEDAPTQLYRDEVAVVDGDGTGNGSVYDSEPLEGNHEYAVRVVGEAGAVTTDPITVITDWTAPATPSVPDLTAESDLGTSATDNLTSATTRTFDLSGVESTATVSLRQTYMGYSWCPFPPFCGPTPSYHYNDRTGSGTLDESDSPGGNPGATYAAMQTDLAGNESASWSSELSVSFDFVPPSVPNAPDLQDASDDGTSATDNVTKQTSLTFDVTGIDSGATAILIRADGQSGGEVARHLGNGAITDTGVPAGDHAYSVVAMDAAGNESYDNTRSITVTVVAPDPVFVPPAPPAPTTTTTTPSTTTTAPSTPPTTDAPPAATAPATSSNPTPRAGETVQLQTTPPAGGGSAGNTAATIDGTKPSAAILLSTNGAADRPMPQPVITKKADGSTSISVQVPADTPPGVYLIAVVGTTPSGVSRVIIVPVVVRRPGAVAPARTASVPTPTPTAAVPAVARSIQASVTAIGGPAVVAQAVEHGATLSIAGNRLIVDSHPAGHDRPVGPVVLVGLLLAAVALLTLNIRRTRSAR